MRIILGRREEEWKGRAKEGGKGKEKEEGEGGREEMVQFWKFLPSRANNSAHNTFPPSLQLYKNLEALKRGLEEGGVDIAVD